ncbi:MAG: tRNA (cytidine(34)-2'-O)-methyltransferase [Waddliaceae bacterium]
MKVVLFEPQIPQNTGNIVRTCSVTGCGLILVEPLGFSTASRHLKRAGLDYWEGIDLLKIDNLDAFLEETDDPFWFFSSKAEKSYADVSYESNDLLIFGSETSGLPPHFEEKYRDRFLRLPMRENKRCLNLATSVGIAVYEAWRQQGFNA